MNLPANPITPAPPRHTLTHAPFGCGERLHCDNPDCISQFTPYRSAELIKARHGRELWLCHGCGRKEWRWAA